MLREAGRLDEIVAHTQTVSVQFLLLQLKGTGRFSELSGGRVGELSGHWNRRRLLIGCLLEAVQAGRRLLSLGLWLGLHGGGGGLLDELGEARLGLWGHHQWLAGEGLDPPEGLLGCGQHHWLGDLLDALDLVEEAGLLLSLRLGLNHCGLDSAFNAGLFLGLRGHGDLLGRRLSVALRHLATEGELLLLLRLRLSLHEAGRLLLFGRKEGSLLHWRDKLLLSSKGCLGAQIIGGYTGACREFHRRNWRRRGGRGVGLLGEEAARLYGLHLDCLLEDSPIGRAHLSDELLLLGGG